MKTIRYLFGAAVFFFLACKKEPETYTIIEKPLNEAVYASGEIFPETYEYVQSNNPERIMKILVKEGDLVKKGEVLVLLGTPSQSTRLTLLTDELRLARQNASVQSPMLIEAQQKVALAREQYEHDSANADRYRDLAAEKAVSRKDADDATLKSQTSLSAYQNLRQQLLIKQKELSGKVLNAAGQLAQFSQLQEGKVLTSNITGKIYSVNLKEGALAKAGEPILMAGSAKQFKLELLVDERDISKVKLGQQVFFETDAFAGRQFSATVSKIVPVLQTENRSLKVEAQVLDTAGFFPQSSVEANILIRQNVSAMVIPVAYLQSGDSVLVRSGQEIKKIAVLVGTRNGAWLEVLSGVGKGDVIVKP
ncbi:efflux RND transporter periplasmic adaptor subunit [Dyadobacter pollutisoli]|uniref:Efflux RND transporter periplasmic adaptor subunit n=1 Tax=Dyadobacter pollutisoli TaxID=2910158 RepID=A0A9E8NB99_9BACT|nr:efflux RND transporter periplasmic adaptor subunit [Dyadobacter pollutisoli]WAC13480.1 efflux RND transporter periplasmic adaptor subunit [Dyadobacter pollutisoli]